MIIAQITDLHFGSTVETADGPVDTVPHVARAVDHLNAFRPAIDVALVTGDLTGHELTEEYAALVEALSRLSMPSFVIPGNHDDRDRLRAAFTDHDYLGSADGFLHYVIEDLPLRLIALDTHDPGKGSGLLCEERLAWFAARLAEAPERPTLVYMHHPPVDVGVPFFDGIACHGGEAMGEIVARNPQIETILCGHVHRSISLRWCGTLLQVTPSTGYQYPLDLIDSETIDPVVEPPACRILLWHPGKPLVSHISYIGKRSGDD